MAIGAPGAPGSLILDAGTGIRDLTGLLGGQPFDGSILLSHLHWDHTHGLPFFRAGDRPDARGTLYLPEQGEAVDVLARGMSPPHFPIRPDQMRGSWAFSGMEEGHHRIGAFDVLAREIPHKGGRTFGYRVTLGDRSVAYMPDHCPVVVGPGTDGLGELHEAALALAEGVDLLIHDSQYWREEYAERSSFGHATPDYALALGEKAGAAQVVLFHHDPERTDEQIAAYVDGLQSPVRFTPARQGTTFDL